MMKRIVYVFGLLMFNFLISAQGDLIFIRVNSAESKYTLPVVFFSDSLALVNLKNQYPKRPELALHVAKKSFAFNDTLNLNFVSSILTENLNLKQSTFNSQKLRLTPSIKFIWYRDNLIMLEINLFDLNMAEIFFKDLLEKTKAIIKNPYLIGRIEENYSIILHLKKLSSR